MAIPVSPESAAGVFLAAQGDLTSAIGDALGPASQQGVGLYGDTYSMLWDEPKERVPSAALAPANVEQVQQIVRIANRHGVPILPISTGRNLAYGGSAPAMRGSVVVDLKRMNRILEFDDKRHFALVEPGVSYFDLYQYITERGLKLMLDLPDPGWGSPLGNSLDHGVGSWLAPMPEAYFEGVVTVSRLQDVQALIDVGNHLGRSAQRYALVRQLAGPAPSNSNFTSAALAGPPDRRGCSSAGRRRRRSHPVWWLGAVSSKPSTVCAFRTGSSTACRCRPKLRVTSRSRARPPWVCRRCNCSSGRSQAVDKAGPAGGAVPVQADGRRTDPGRSVSGPDPVGPVARNDLYGMPRTRLTELRAPDLADVFTYLTRSRP